MRMCFLRKVGKLTVLWEEENAKGVVYKRMAVSVLNSYLMESKCPLRDFDRVLMKKNAHKVCVNLSH